ncbi:hypothetical protein [Aquimarina sp. 2201CG14-23]|uniref:hypothetical protein n=1 Tax=Aquimarina mycalae TaxID=3040073 RepID=UPI002477DC66|nr:hypothetical protein [Aquimarina sp. 2201CG14-23]MDH7447766.1 hypothetical protein [Aquimarina sp. 2201CG14-23]
MSSQIHIAAQYLAAAGISFLPKKDDDSHTNLGFNSEKGYLETWPLNDQGCKITFDYLNFALHWVANSTVRLSILLDGKTHQEVVSWMESLATTLGLKNPFVYKLHYDLPYDPITNDFVFRKPSDDVLQELLEQRILAQHVLEKTISSSSLTSDIRIWPHHFDIGAFSSLKNKEGVAIGLGMAIPDTIHNDYYFYISGYKGHDGIDTTGFNKLTLGSWSNEGFKGATLPIKGVTEEQGVTFFKEALAIFKN